MGSGGHVRSELRAAEGPAYRTGRRAAVRVLRRPAQCQRPAGHPPRDGPHHQGHLLPLPNAARQARGPQGRLGYARAAHRTRCGEGARHHQGGHRQEHLRGGLQPQVQGGGDALHRRVERPHEAHRLLARHGAPLRHLQDALHRKRVVAVEAAARKGPLVQGLHHPAVFARRGHRPQQPRTQSARHLQADEGHDRRGHVQGEGG